MARLLPSSSDVDPNDTARVVGLEDDAAGELIDALSSETTRTVLAALHEEPASPSELATRVDTSLQNVQYHLGKLEDAGLVEVGETVYSEKGREMNVYIPADRALVVVAGNEEETSGLRAALSRLLGGVGVLGVASVVIDRLARQGRSVGFGTAADGADGGSGGDGGGVSADAGAPTSQADAGAGGGADATATPTEAATETQAESVDLAEATTTTTGPTEAATTTPTAEQLATQEPTATLTPAATEQPTATLTPAATEQPTPTPTPMAETPVTVTPTDVTTALETTASASTPGVVDGLATSPGLLFFLGGATVLVGGFVWWWVRS